MTANIVDDYTYENIAKNLHSKERYKHLPLDIVDEIIELSKKRHSSDRVQTVFAYFEHALKSKVVKRFELTNKEKQLLFVSINFLDLFLNDATKKYKDVENLHNLLARIATRHHKDLEKQLEFAYKQFAKIIDNEDILCNHLILSTTTATFFAKSADIDTKLAKRITKLANKIHDDVAKTEADTIMYQNAAKICGDFYKKVEAPKKPYVIQMEENINSMVDNILKGDDIPENLSEIIARKLDASKDLVNLVLSKRDDFE